MMYSLTLERLLRLRLCSAIPLLHHYSTLQSHKPAMTCFPAFQRLLRLRLCSSIPLLHHYSTLQSHKPTMTCSPAFQRLWRWRLSSSISLCRHYSPTFRNLDRHFFMPSPSLMGNNDDTVTAKRVALFESIQAQQSLHRLSLPLIPSRLFLPDGSVKEGKKFCTTPNNVAEDLSKSLALNAVVARVDGVLWDMSRPLEVDCELELYSLDSCEGRDTFWNSIALILAQDFLDIRFGDRGEYCEQFEDDFQKAVSEKQPFERIEASREQALELFFDNKYKVEFISGLSEEKTVTVYKCGSLVDLSCGPHITNTSIEEAFCCLKADYAIPYPHSWKADYTDEILVKWVKSCIEFVQFLIRTESV